MREAIIRTLEMKMNPQILLTKQEVGNDAHINPLLDSDNDLEIDNEPRSTKISPQNDTNQLIHQGNYSL